MADVQPADPRHALSEGRLTPGITYGLYLAGFLTAGLTTAIGLILAYARLADAGPMTFSHYRFLIRTFWLGIAWALIGLASFSFGVPLSLVLIGIPFVKLGLLIWALMGIWYAVRCVAGLIYLSRGQVYPRPRSWFF